MKNPNSLEAEAMFILKAADIDEDLRLVLVFNTIADEVCPFITWKQVKATHGCQNGNYFRTLDEAVEDFDERIAVYRDVEQGNLTNAWRAAFNDMQILGGDKR